MKFWFLFHFCFSSCFAFMCFSFSLPSLQFQSDEGGFKSVKKFSSAHTDTITHHAFHRQRQEEGSGSAQAWVGLLWLTRRHWPVWQPDKLTLCLNWPRGIIPRQHASPIGSCHMMFSDNHGPFYHRKEWILSIHGHRCSKYDKCNAAEYANTESIWVNKVNLNTFTHVSAF